MDTTELILYSVIGSFAVLSLIFCIILGALDKTCRLWDRSSLLTTSRTKRVRRKTATAKHNPPVRVSIIAGVHTQQIRASHREHHPRRGPHKPNQGVTESTSHAGVHTLRIRASLRAPPTPGSTRCESGRH